MGTLPSGGEFLEFKYIAVKSFALSAFDTACGSGAQGETIDLQSEPGGTRCIQTPSFPDNYPSNQVCKWTIQTPDRIGYNVQFFHLESATPCNTDFVTLTVDSVTGDAKCNRDLQGTTATDLASPVILDLTIDSDDNFPGFLICFQNIATTPTTTAGDDDDDNDDFIETAILVAFYVFFINALGPFLFL
ncbi:mannan-binding lectin serine protease 1-like [Argopecten irradians]|uniref:mannan-binding lectin serine protease 1-like n=1 Tax=Argopecten irradians TaxID=31199 RepID=UPI003719D44F